jgi:hypothetical protein
MILTESIRITRDSETQTTDTVLAQVEKIVALEPGKRNAMAITEAVYTFSVPRRCLCYDQSPDGSKQSSKNFNGAGSGWPYYHKTLTDQGKANRPKLLEAAANFLEREILRSWAASKGVCLLQIAGKEQFLTQNGKIVLEPDTNPHSFWVLPLLGESGQGNLLMGVVEVPENPEPGIDWINSVELGKLLLKQAAATPQLDETLHALSGISRNPFACPDFRKGSPEENIRIYGWDGENLDRETCTNVIRSLPQWEVPLAPDSRTSRLIFVPHDSVELTDLQEAIQSARDLKFRYFAAKKAKNRNTEVKTEETLPCYLPCPPIRAKVLMGYRDGQKKKWITMDFVPEVPIHYWWALEWVLTTLNVFRHIKEFTKQAVAGTTEGKDYPLHLKYWTDIFSMCLHAWSLSILPFWSLTQAFNKSLRTDQLIGSQREYPQGALYLEIINILQALQFAILNRWRKWGSETESDDFLTAFQSTDRTNLTLMPKNKLKPLSAEIYFPEVWERLKDFQQEKLNDIVNLSWAGVPENEESLFFRGIFAGIALHEVANQVKKGGRSFNPTLGMHPSNMKGKALVAPFLQAAGLAQNADKIYIPGFLTPFIKGMEEDSESNAFNEGFVIGMAYRGPKKIHEEESAEASTTPSET